MRQLITSEEILEADDLYELQDSFSGSGTSFKYQMTDAEVQWFHHIHNKYEIANWVQFNTDRNYILFFSDPETLSEALQADGIPNKAVMLSDDTALQKLFFWLSIND